MTNRPNKIAAIFALIWHHPFPGKCNIDPFPRAYIIFEDYSYCHIASGHHNIEPEREGIQ
jgi:hypothetical protein